MGHGPWDWFARNQRALTSFPIRVSCYKSISKQAAYALPVRRDSAPVIVRHLFGKRVKHFSSSEDQHPPAANMTGLPGSSHCELSAVEAAGRGDPPENLQELLGDAIPPVQAALRKLLGLDGFQQIAYPKEQIALVQNLAAVNTSSLRRRGLEPLSDLVDNSTRILEATATLIDRWRSPDDARRVASMALLQPAPARAALLRLLAAIMNREPCAQFPAAFGDEDEQGQGQGQPTALQDSDAPCSTGEWEQPGEASAAEAAAEAAAQRLQPSEAAGYTVRLAQELPGLREGVCHLMCHLLVDNSSLPELMRCDMAGLLLSLDTGCLLLQARLLQCLSRQLAAVSEGLLGQLPPEAAALPQPMRGQQQQQHGDRNQQEEARACSPLPGAAQGGAPGRAAAASRDGVTGPLRAAEHAIKITTALMTCLYSVMTLAADAYVSDSPAAAGSGSSSGPGPSHGSQQPDAAGVKQLRQLSRRCLLLMAGGLRDSHLYDHWARALLLSALCRGAGERNGEEEEGGEMEEWTGREISTQAASVADKEREHWSERGVSGKAGRAAAVLAADAAGGSQQDPESQQQQHATSSAFYEQVYWHIAYSTGSVILNLREATKSGSNSLPPGLCTALQQALSGPCIQHLTLALGTLMLHQADGGSLYGMPLPYRTGSLWKALAASTHDLAAGGSGAPPLQVLDRRMYRTLQRLLFNLGTGLPQPLPAVPPEGHLDLLLRLGQLAVRSAQAYRGQGGSTGERVAVIEQQDVGDMALTCLQTARGILASRAERTPVDVGPAAGVGAGAGTGTGAGSAGGAVGAVGGRDGMGGAGAEGPGTDTVQAAGPSGFPVGQRDAAARRAARAAVAAETRWHRLLLDTGLWVEMEGKELDVWAGAWNHFESLGQPGEGTGALPPSAPTPVDGALAAGVLPCLERVLRRAGERAARGPRFSGEPPLLQGLLSYECRWRPWLGWLLSYGDVRQGAAFMVTLRKMAVQAQGQQQEQQRQLRQRRPPQRNAPDELSAAMFVTYRKAPNVLKFAVQLGRRAGAAGDCGNVSGGGAGRGSGYDSGGGGGGGSTAAPGGQVAAASMDSPGLPRLQLLLWYGVRQLMPPMVQMAVGNKANMGGSWADRDVRWTAAHALTGDVLRPVAVLALQIAGGSGGSSGSDDGGGGSSGVAEGNDGGAGGSAGLSSCNVSRVVEGGSGGDSGSPPAWLSSWRRVLLEEWRVVELVGSALEQLVPALGSNISAAILFDKFHTMQSLVVALCSVALAFPDRVWSAAGGPAAETQREERQAKGSQRGGGSSSSGSSKGGGKRAAPAPATPTVLVWPTGRVVQLLDAVRTQHGMGYAHCLEPELDALSQLVDLVQAGGPELPYKCDMPFVRATMKLKAKSERVGGFRWLCDGEGPSPELLDGLLRTCSYPWCASLDGDSEAGPGGRLAACGRGCGAAWYCCRACAEAHWREGHAEACGGGARGGVQGRSGRGAKGGLQR